MSQYTEHILYSHPLLLLLRHNHSTSTHNSSYTSKLLPSSTEFSSTQPTQGCPGSRIVANLSVCFRCKKTFSTIIANAVVLKPSQHLPAEHVHPLTLLTKLSLLNHPHLHHSNWLIWKGHTLSVTPESPFFHSTWAAVGCCPTAKNTGTLILPKHQTERSLCANGCF